MKKALFVFAGILLISTMVFAGGRKDAGAAAGSAQAPLNISIFHETGGHPQPNADNPIYKYIKDKFNVTFTWDILVGDIAQRRGTMIAGGAYPDIMELRGAEWIDAGALIPLDDLIEKHGPRIKALYKDVWEQMKYTDGKIYYLVNFGVIQGLDHRPNYDQTAFWIQKDILKKAGYPKVVTLDEYFKLIEDYYKANPTINGQPTIPFTVLTHDWRAFELWNPPNFLAGNPNDGNGVVNPRTHEYKTFFTMDISKRWFQYFNQLNARGLVDRAGFTDNYDQYSAKISSGRVLGQSVQGWQFMYQADMANRDRGENHRTMAPLAIVFDSSIKPWYRNRTIPNLYRGMGISTSAKDPVRIIQFINALLEEDVQRTLTWGIEGQHWQYDDKKVPYRTQAQRDNWNNNNWQTLNRARLMDDIFPKIQGSFSDKYPADLNDFYPERQSTLRPEDRELLEAYGVGGTNQLMDPDPRPNNIWFPTWNMPTPPAGSPADIAIKKCEETMKQRLPQIVLAPPADFERLWNAYVQEMTVTNRIADYEAYMQDMLNQRIKAWSGK
ncbi:MAG: extracellular solute-binding protein [Treponema sp.]|jgi:putative aldouronate transport system substrate-binding protein|nr:extracellular solute-binding protein [Treponema sp.]